jgi:hypothetical protein
LEMVPTRSIPCSSVTGRRASVRPRRVKAASRSRQVALSRSMSAVAMTPSPCERRLSVSTRAGVPATLRRSTAATRRGSERFTTCASRRCRHGRHRGRPWAPVRSGARNVSRSARIEAHHPSVQHKRGRCRAPPRPRAMRRRMSGRSRRGLTAPARHKRVLTSSAKAIHTRPPWVLTRIASAGTCPRSRGCSTRGAWTA